MKRDQANNDPPKTRRRPSISVNVVSGGFTFLIEVGIVLTLGLVSFAVAAVVLSLV